MKITALIPAHNEEEVIAHTIANLRAANPDSIIVIADGCADSTAQRAEASGAIVFQRNALQTSEVLGKGGALRWLFSTDLAGLEDPRGLFVIFDADSTVTPNFFAEVRRVFEGGVQAAQSFVAPIIPDASLRVFEKQSQSETEIASQRTLAMTVPTLAAYSEILSQVFDDDVRSRLGWSVPLRGTGMAFRVELLRELLPHVHTRTEDIELSLLLAQRGVRVKFLRDAVVYDPKPRDAARVSRQRARWLQGQMQVWRSYWKMILHLLLRGAEMGWLLSALLLKPKTFFIVLKFVVGVVSLFLPIHFLLKLLFAFPFIAEIFYYGFGLMFVPSQDRSRYASALLRAPLYVVVWAQSLITAMRERDGWLSVRH
ncbi:MAG: glycosyltransferase [Chloroflexi bacterium]|nr:glycosyltransferase [Chloroflexota bacterium]